MKIHAKIFSLVALFLLSFLSNQVLGQSYQEITSSGRYVFGEGKGRSASEAGRLALSSVSEQLNVFVTSVVDISRKKIKVNDTSSVTMTTEDIVNTYSQVSLTNCYTMMLENGPKTYRVLRYVSKEDVEETFKARESKILEYIRIAEKAELDLKMDVALKYYYWSQLLTKTLIADTLTYSSIADNESYNVDVWVPNKIDQILDNIDFVFKDFTENDKTIGMVSISYSGKPISTMDYSYFDGINWSSIVHAKNGLGALEFRADAIPSNVNFKIEYSYESEMCVDSDLEDMSQYLEQITYPSAWKNAIPIKPQIKQLDVPESDSKISRRKLRKDTQVASNAVSMYQVIADDNMANQLSNLDSYTVNAVDDKAPYIAALNTVLGAIQQKNYSQVDESLFTDEGYQIYNELITYGNAKLLVPNGVDMNEYIEMVNFNDTYFCRSIPMQFSFSNNKKFIENVIFEFDEFGKIASLQFALEKSTIDEVTSMSRYSEGAKMIIINFLENYQTAFALKRIDFLNSIFSEDAIIITGRVVKTVDVEDRINLRESHHIEYNTQTKSEYIGNLRNSFRRKEYINLSFSNFKVTRMAKSDREVFCMELKQDYFSSNYGDSGYLLLMVDVNDYKHPIIHVRTWQPEPDPDFGLFSPGDF